MELKRPKPQSFYHTKTYNPLVQLGLDKKGLSSGYWPTEIAHWLIEIWKNWPFDLCALSLKTFFLIQQNHLPSTWLLPGKDCLPQCAGKYHYQIPYTGYQHLI